MVGEGILYIFSINLSIAIKECGVSIFKMVVYFSKGLFFSFFLYYPFHVSLMLWILFKIHALVIMQWQYLIHMTKFSNLSRQFFLWRKLVIVVLDTEKIRQEKLSYIRFLIERFTLLIVIWCLKERHANLFTKDVLAMQNDGTSSTKKGKIHEARV